jgi:hypothetical protein
LSLTLVVCMWPSQQLKLIQNADPMGQFYYTQMSGRYSNGQPFKLVRPNEVPTPYTAPNFLAGLRLRQVKVVRPAALSQEQIEWLLSRRFAITKEEFIIQAIA